MRRVDVLHFRTYGVLLLFCIALAGCDVIGSEETVILNANSPVPPTVEYEFEYTPDALNASGQLEVRSQETDDLEAILSENGFQRGDVTAARIDSVFLRRLSAPTAIRGPAKVFQYLSGADVFLGSSASGVRIAAEQFDTDEKEITLSLDRRTATEVVKGGPSLAFVRLDTDGEVPESDRVEVTVHFQLTVEGV